MFSLQPLAGAVDLHVPAVDDDMDGPSPEVDHLPLVWHSRFARPRASGRVISSEI